MPEKKEPIKRSFSSPEELVENAKVAYAVGVKRVNQAELDAGFDVYNKESVLAFDPGFVPIGNTLLVKEIPKFEEEETDPNKLGLIDLSNAAKKFWVVAVSPNVPGILKKGDIVTMYNFKDRPVYTCDRVLKGVRFTEMSTYDISGIFANYEDILKRVPKTPAAFAV